MKTTANRRKLKCIICTQLRPINKFPMSAVFSRYSRVCDRCEYEQKETENFLKEQENDPSYHAFMRNQYNK